MEDPINQPLSVSNTNSDISNISPSIPAAAADLSGSPSVREESSSVINTSSSETAHMDNTLGDVDTAASNTMSTADAGAGGNAVSSGGGGGGNGPSKLFYLLVAVTVILFLGLLTFMGYLLKNNMFLNTSSVTPTPVAKTVTSPTPQLGVVNKQIDAQTAKLSKQGSSNEVGEIAKDIESTDLSQIDGEITQMEKEISTP